MYYTPSRLILTFWVKLVDIAIGIFLNIMCLFSGICHIYLNFKLFYYSHINQHNKYTYNKDVWFILDIIKYDEDIIIMTRMKQD